MCNVRKFCRRNGLFQQKLLDGDDERLSGFGYFVEEVQVQNSSILLILTQQSQSFYFASQLTANLTFYQDGILRIHMEEVGSPLREQTFRASDFAGVEEQQLRPVTDL